MLAKNGNAEIPSIFDFYVEGATDVSCTVVIPLAGRVIHSLQLEMEEK